MPIQVLVFLTKFGLEIFIGMKKIIELLDIMPLVPAKDLNGFKNYVNLSRQNLIDCSLLCFLLLSAFFDSQSQSSLLLSRLIIARSLKLHIQINN